MGGTDSPACVYTRQQRRRPHMKKGLCGSEKKGGGPSGAAGARLTAALLLGSRLQFGQAAAAAAGP